MSSSKKPTINITAFDKKVSELFYGDNEASTFFNAFSVNQVRYGTSLQSNFFELLIKEVVEVNSNAKQSLLNNIKVKVRTWGLDQFYKLINPSSIRSAFSFNGSESREILFFAENYVKHILDDFIKVIEAMDAKSTVLFISNDKRSIKYMQTKLPGVNIMYIGLRTITAKQSVAAIRDIKKLYKRIRLTRRERRNVFAEFGKIDKKVAATLAFNFLMLPFYTQLFQTIINRIHPAKLVIGCDAFSLSRVFIDVCRNNGVKTFVIQHGMLQGYNGYLPLYADAIFLWSEKEKAFLKEIGFHTEDLIVTGAPRFSGIKAHEKLPKEHITITFISSDFYISEVEKTLDDLEAISKRLQVPNKIVFRPHPHVKLLIEKNYNSKRDRFQNIEIDKSPVVNETLEKTDFAIVSNCSTTIFELTARNIPFCVIEAYEKEDAGINLYNFPRYTINQIVEEVHTFYNNQLSGKAQSGTSSLNESFTTSTGALHYTSPQNISTYLTTA